MGVLFLLVGSFITVKTVKVLVTQSCPTLCDPIDCSPARLLCLWDSPGKSTGVGLPFPAPGDLPNPDIEPRSPSFQADSLLSEPPIYDIVFIFMNIHEEYIPKCKEFSQIYFPWASLVAQW